MFSFLTAPKLLITALIASVFTVAVIQTNYQHAMVGNYYVDPYFACQQIISPLIVTSELKDRKVGECLFDICLSGGGNMTTAEMKNFTDGCVLKAGGIAAIKARAGCGGAGEGCEQRATAAAFCKIYVPLRGGNGVEDEFLGCGLIGDTKDCLQCCGAQNQDDDEGLKTCYEKSCYAPLPSEESEEFNNCANCVVQLMTQGEDILEYKLESCMQGLGGGGPEAICGDGICDGENPGTCPVDCTEPGPTCGDGNPDPWENCDDGNLEDGDGCSSTCEFESLGGGEDDMGGFDPSGGFDESTGGAEGGLTIGGLDDDGDEGDNNDEWANLEQGDDWGNLEQGEDQGGECSTASECKAEAYSCMGTPPNPANQAKCAAKYESCMACEDPSGGSDWAEDGGDMSDNWDTGADDWGADVSDADTGGDMDQTSGGAQGGGGGESCEQKCKAAFKACYESTGDSETCGDAYQSCIERCSNMDGGTNGGFAEDEGDDQGGDSCVFNEEADCPDCDYRYCLCLAGATYLAEEEACKQAASDCYYGCWDGEDGADGAQGDERGDLCVDCMNKYGDFDYCVDIGMCNDPDNGGGAEAATGGDIDQGSGGDDGSDKLRCTLQCEGEIDFQACYEDCLNGGDGGDDRGDLCVDCMNKYGDFDYCVDIGMCNDPDNGGGFDTGDIFGDDQGTVGGAFGEEGAVGDNSDFGDDGNIFGDADEGGIDFGDVGDDGFGQDQGDFGDDGFGQDQGDFGDIGFGVDFDYGGLSGNDDGLIGGVQTGDVGLFGGEMGERPIGGDDGRVGGNNAGEFGVFGGEVPGDGGRSAGVQSVYEGVSSAVNGMVEGITSGISQAASTVGSFFRGLFGGN